MVSASCLLSSLFSPSFVPAAGGTHRTAGANDPDRLWSIRRRDPRETEPVDGERRPDGAQALHRSLLIVPHDRLDHEPHHWSCVLERWIQQARRHHGRLAQEGTARAQHRQRRLKGLF